MQLCSAWEPVYWFTNDPDRVRSDNRRVLVEDTEQHKKSSKGNKQTVVGLKHKVAELESELDAAQRSNSLLTVMVSELRSRLKQLAQHDGTVEERQELYREYNRKIEAQMNYTLNGEI
jgi:predicted RNase H-like nuclease (RuvC/YqgF family)